MIEQKQPVSIENRLKSLLQCGEDCVSTVQGMIDKGKLPYIILPIEEFYSSCHDQKLMDGKCPICDSVALDAKLKTIYTLRSTYTPGELHLLKFITVDPLTLRMKEEANLMSKTDYPVLVYGETGTGKEIISKSQIDNRTGEIKCVNCAGFPRELMEAELFGYMAGAFTDARKTAEGLIMAATDGLMFFDEIGEMPMDLQSKLLRVLQEKTIRKVGGKIEEKVNCKFVFATNCDLRKMVEVGTFRKDLYARISTLELRIGNLKDRKCDIVPITRSLPDGNKFLEKYQDSLLSGVLDLSLNVRSLEQYVIRYKVLGRITNDI